jgi:hypothetical protein
VFLAPKEESYVEFLKMRNVPLEQMPTPEVTDGGDILDKIRTYVSRLAGALTSEACPACRHPVWLRSKETQPAG